MVVFGILNNKILIFQNKLMKNYYTSRNNLAKPTVYCNPLPVFTYAQDLVSIG